MREFICYMWRMLEVIEEQEGVERVYSFEFDLVNFYFIFLSFIMGELNLIITRE